MAFDYHNIYYKDVIQVFDDFAKDDVICHSSLEYYFTESDIDFMLDEGWIYAVGSKGGYPLYSVNRSYCYEI